MISSLTTIEELVSERLLSPTEANSVQAVGDRYRIRIPRYYASLMRPFDHPQAAKCPIRAQALPQIHETDPMLPDWATAWSLAAFGRPVPWITDPIGDLEKLGALRLTHRYENRALLHVSSLCALYCRFCFRKEHLNEKEKLLYEGSLDEALHYVKAHTEIEELILTGGDPLSMNDTWYERFFEKLAQVSHLRQVRIHSRMAVTLPARLTEGLATVLSSQLFSVALVSHFNHPRELTKEALARLQLFRRKGVALYNQAVLLRGVNDNSSDLRELFQSLYNAGVNPFYLHHTDLTPGTFHFRASIERGQELMHQLQGKLSGPALPHYVLDTPGGLGKVPLLSARVRKVDARVDGAVSGALYEVQPPHTRTSKAVTDTGMSSPARPGFVPYFDFFPS